MASTAFKGPVISFGMASSLGNALDYNNFRGPSVFDMGIALMDPRGPFCYNPGNTSFDAHGWFGVNDVILVDAVPSTITTTAIAALQVPVAATPLTLVSATGAGITASSTVVNLVTGQTVTGLLAIDGAMSYVQPAAGGGTRLWDPTKSLARAVSIASAGNDTGATFTVRGYDIYGAPMTETITGANAGTATGAKAFKYLASITPAGTLSGSNVSAGQSDKIGFMLRVDRFQYLRIFWPDTTGITSNTGFTAADTTDPATATTGDVRGTYALQTSASNNTRRLVIAARIPVSTMSASDTPSLTKALVGITQV